MTLQHVPIQHDLNNYNADGVCVVQLNSGLKGIKQPENLLVIQYYIAMTTKLLKLTNAHTKYFPELFNETSCYDGIDIKGTPHQQPKDQRQQKLYITPNHRMCSRQFLSQYT